MDVLQAAMVPIFDAVIFIISKTVIFFWSLLRCVCGYPRIQRKRPRDIDLARYEDNSQFLGTIRLYRHDTPDEAFVYGHCHNNDWDIVVKGVLHERKASGKNEFYLYTDNPSNESIEAMRMPAPLTISFLDNAFRSEVE